MAWSSESSSCSPADELSSGKRPEGSKRRSITEMSQSARMTPQSQRSRGLGMPWLQPQGLCALDVQPGDIDEARQFCLLPTPELGEKPEIVPNSPEVHSPSSMQRRFVDLVHRASLGQHSPSSQGSGVPGSPETTPRRRRSSLVSLLESTPDAIPSVSPRYDSSPMSEASPTSESHIIPGQVPACSSGAVPWKVPLLCRLSERLSNTKDSGLNNSFSTLVSADRIMTQKVSHESLGGNTDIFLQPSCAIFEDVVAPRKTIEAKRCIRPKYGVEKRQKLPTAKKNKRYLLGESSLDFLPQELPRGSREKEKALTSLMGKAEQRKQAIIRGNGHLKAIAKQATDDAMEKACAAERFAKVKSGL